MRFCGRRRLDVTWAKNRSALGHWEKMTNSNRFLTQPVAWTRKTSTSTKSMRPEPKKRELHDLVLMRFSFFHLRTFASYDVAGE